MGKMNILDPSGHTEVLWDVADAGSVAVAEAKFAELVGGGTYVAFKTGLGEDSTRVTEFDPSVYTELVLVPQLRGG